MSKEIGGAIPSGLADTLATSTDTTYVDAGADPALPYYYVVSAVDVHGNEGQISNEASVSPVLAVEGDPARGPSEFVLYPAHPNPFTLVTSILYSIPAGRVPSHVTLKVYDTAGREVTTLADVDQGAGEHRIIWDGRDHNGAEVASGVYFCRIEWNGRTKTGRMVLLR